jgi:hypothetical protein
MAARPAFHGGASGLREKTVEMEKEKEDRGDVAT